MHVIIFAVFFVPSWWVEFIQAHRRECVFRGIVAMHDPLRMGVADAVHRIKESGACVMMITGMPLSSPLLLPVYVKVW
jgi:hypothetical protein